MPKRLIVDIKQRHWSRVSTTDACREKTYSPNVIYERLAVEIPQSWQSLVVHVVRLGNTSILAELGRSCRACGLCTGAASGESRPSLSRSQQWCASTSSSSASLSSLQMSAAALHVRQFLFAALSNFLT